MLESVFLKWILEAFEYDRNIFMFRRNVGAARYEKANGKKGFIRFAEAGQSDLWGWINKHHCPFCNRLQVGTHFEIEVKNEKGKLTKLQHDWLVFVADHGGIAIELRPEPTDPIGLRERITKILTEQKCPLCLMKETI